MVRHINLAHELNLPELETEPSTSRSHQIYPWEILLPTICSKYMLWSPKSKVRKHSGSIWLKNRFLSKLLKLQPTNNNLAGIWNLNGSRRNRREEYFGPYLIRKIRCWHVHNRNFTHRNQIKTTYATILQLKIDIWNLVSQSNNLIAQYFWLNQGGISRCWSILP